MAKNCWTSSSSSAGRLRQEPSITKNSCTSSSIREEFLDRHFLVELFRSEVDIVLVGRGYLPNLNRSSCASPWSRKKTTDDGSAHF